MIKTKGINPGCLPDARTWIFSSGKDIKNEEDAENKATSSGTENITDEGGRPALKTEEKSEKTMSNIENKE